VAVAGTHLAQNTTSGISPASGSVSPTANRLILVAVAIYTSAGTPSVNSVTGNGITYTLIASAAAVDDGFGPYRIHLYRGMSASPSAGAITASLSGASDQCDFSISEFSGVDTSGTNGSGAIVQSTSGVVNEQTSLALTLAAFGAAGNGAYGCLVSYDDVPITPGTGWTELDDATQIQTQWRADNDTSPDWSWSGTRDAGAIAVEIKADGGGGGAATPRLLGLLGCGT
jgi:hypothetical protein